ncbi:HAMP domain-containing protein [Rhodococcus sp. PAMC28707]|uniref:HAMP domain-containing sensor histidine kinase n=1 Tax=unclassified Rhodococcus (in: high G+C Gram-positive bacteria) TaxID=192944 RepID=UPI00109DE1F1|nr:MULTISPECIES: ATP-binding protein [unclassified Rhodococcus (in: high G+C Gram-positive bacteria)]QCB49629.1 HAMP domain-containing protein [Rhodococcus sp. PAMC28705]QCB58680.1 HAMP domain-containing protein [Rhodococcus sp. PAMC28707]
MKHDAQTTSWWSIGEWRLGWKVIAVFAVPMLVAVLFGGLRIQSELTDAADLNTSAERTFAVPAALRLEQALKAVTVAASSGADTGTATARATTALQEFGVAANVFRTDASLSNLVDKAMQDSRALIDEVPTSPERPIQLVARYSQVSTELWIPFADLLSKSELPLLRERGAELTPLWGARRTLANQHILYGTGDLDPQMRTIFASTAGAELASLGGLIPLAVPGGVLPPTGTAGGEDPMAGLNSLKASTQGRLGAIGATPSTSPLSREIGLGLQASSDQYDAITDAAIARFVPTVIAETSAAQSAALRDAALVVGTVLAALVLALVISRSLVEPIQRLRFAALTAARHGLPEAIERIRAGERIVDLEIPRVPVETHEEIGQLARAVDDMHGQAITLAGEQATLRRQVNDMFETLSRRNKSLVEQQLVLIEQLEKDEDDPNRLENLFRLDHIAARMRRNSDNLLILSGNEGRRARTAPIALADALRASASGVEDYLRVELGQILSAVVSGQASADVVHLVTELLDNALRYSPPETTVTIDAARTNDGSVLVEITDLGIGMSPDDLLDANRRLSSGGEMSPDTARHMGLFVVSRISSRYGISVRLRPSAGISDRSGITAMVHLPIALLEASRDTAIRTSTAALASQARAASPVQSVAAGAPTSSQGALPYQAASVHNAEAAVASGNWLPHRQSPQPVATTMPPAFSAAPAAFASQASPVALPMVNGLPRRTPGSSGVPGTANAFTTQPIAPPPPTPEIAVAQPDTGEFPAARPMPRAPFGAPNPNVTAAFFSSRPRDSTPRRIPTPPRETTPPRDWTPPRDPTPPRETTPPRDWTPPRDPTPPRETTPPRDWTPPRDPTPPRETTPPRDWTPPRDPTPPPAGVFSANAPEAGSDVRPPASPIFAGMVSEWLIDPTDDKTGATNGSIWTTEADEGWVAAHASTDRPSSKMADSGLPIRDRGARLVPGAVKPTNGSTRSGSHRQRVDPETIRRGWSDYQSGLSRGRRHISSENNTALHSITHVQNDEGEQ